jgi:hypothetical protein
VKKGGDCCDAAQTDKASERDCGRRCSRQKGQSVIDKRNTRNEKNAQTQRERDTAADMDEARLMETTKIYSLSFTPRRSIFLFSHLFFSQVGIYVENRVKT